MTKKRKKNEVPADRDPLHPEKKLVTRRDFLSVAAKGFAGAVVLPSMLDVILFERAARAGLVCPNGGAFPGAMPFLVFDMAGGGAISGNWVATDGEGKNGQPLPSYSGMGLGNLDSCEVSWKFGAPMAGPTPPPDTDPPTIVTPGTAFNANGLHSAMFLALTNTDVIPESIQSKLRMGIFCHTGMSDSQGNKHSAMALVAASGAVGSKVKYPLAQRASISGGNSDVAAPNPSAKPMLIQSVTALSSALSLGPAFASMSTKSKDAMATAARSISSVQLPKFLKMTMGEQFATLFGCNNDFSSFTSGSGGVDARLDPIFQRIYGINAGTNPNNPAAVEATIVMNVLRGNSGPGVLTLGGCDYHDGTRTTGDNRDTDIAVKIRSAVLAADALGVPFAFQLLTDGQIYSDPNQRTWRGDDNDKCMTIFGIYDPRGPRDMVSYQINRFTAGQGADRTHYIGTDGVKVAHSVFLNYLAVCGMMGRYDEVVSKVTTSNTVNSNMRDKLLLFPDSKG